jgi:hypothetical protein
MQLETLPARNCLKIKSSGPCFRESDVEDIVRALIPQRETSFFVFDLSSSQTLEISALRKLANYFLARDLPDLRIAVIGHQTVQDSITQEGLEFMFEFFASFEALWSSPKPLADERLATFMHEITDTVARIFFDSLKMTAEPHASGPPIAAEDIVAGMKIDSLHFSGMVMIRFPRATYRGFLSKYFGVDPTSMNIRTEDGAMEFLNVIVSKTQGKLNTKGFGIQCAIPVALSENPPGHSTMVPIQTELGSFSLEFAVEALSP